MIRLAAGENLDLKAYEADMRFLIDSYIEADDPRKISAFDEVGLLELIVKTGVAEAIKERLGKGASNRKAVAETIENNFRRTIISERANDPAFYDRMSQVLAEIINFVNNRLRPMRIPSAGCRSCFCHNQHWSLIQLGKGSLALNGSLELALRIDNTIRRVRPDGWRGNQAKSNKSSSTLRVLQIPMKSSGSSQLLSRKLNMMSSQSRASANDRRLKY